ncbi:MAG: bacillithiol system redox-active protein YtxJ [Crocinitomicaceae bacterium]|nr:bacillithiol system redox-active protein YtxJ [Crocinitomicaceae bacterium]|tara:strand:+ start:118 stop:447 length:330 start_codon:yes stop_codon:yes gene_type:complete
MKWNTLESMKDWTAALEASDEQPVVVFKHSNRCNISRMALKLTEQRWELPACVKPFLLDLLNHRTVSNAISQDLETEHQSPQLLLVRNGKTVHCANHSNIDPVDLLPYL